MTEGGRKKRENTDLEQQNVRRGNLALFWYIYVCHL